MKKVKHLIFCASAFLLVTVPAFAAKTAGASTDGGICELVKEFQHIFKLVRTLAFVGAGFMLARYAWEMITTGKLAKKDDLVEGLKLSGLPMLIGCILLFAIGAILTGLLNGNTIGCAEVLKTGWK